MVSNPVGWFEIYVDDLTRAKTFYETVLQVELSPLGGFSDMPIEMLGFPADMDRYGASGALAKMPNVKAGSNSTLIYFSCEDCAVEESRVQAAGGSVQQSKFSIGEHGYISIATDSEGNTIGFHSMK